MTPSVIAAAFLFATPTAPVSQACKEAAPGLRAKAVISCLAARRAALQNVTGKDLRVVSAELEEERGRIIYSFDIASRGSTGVEEIQIDARSGKLVSKKHESVRSEAAEKD